MMGLITILTVGFVLGMRHAADPDHVIAVTTIVSNQRSIVRAAWIGILWGVGHTVTLFLVGTLIILFNLVIPARVGLGMELSVGLMLMVLGVMSLTSLPRVSLQRDTRADGSRSHSHHAMDCVPDHPSSLLAWGYEDEQSSVQHPLARFLRRLGVYQAVRSFVVGIVHGLAGSAAVALLVLTTIQDPARAVGYLLVFGVGTIAGMMLITMSLASTFHLIGRRYETLMQRLNFVPGVISLSFGILVVFQICFLSGLLTSHPQWILK